MDYTEHLAKNTPPSTIDTFKKVKPGYTLEKYSGQPIKEALLAMGKFNTGANIDAQRSSTLEYLTIRRHMKNFIPKKNKVLMEFKDQNGKKVTINFPWLTLYQCEQEKDGTLISTYDKYTLESGSNVLKNKKANVFKTSNQVASTQERKGTYLTSKIIGSSGYLQVPTFHVTKRDQFDKEMRDFISDLKKNGAESLIVDVRNNGGGYITLAEKLVQYLTKGEIELSRFRFKNTEKNIKYFSSPKFGGRNQNTFLGLAELLEGSNAYYSLTTPLLKRHHMEGTYVFQRENPFQQIDILTNSNCYSACDMFVAQMQDHGSAKVWGIDSKRTGAGGATVEVYSEFKARSTKYADFEVTPKLPGGQDMRFSFLQYIRNKKNAGKILENSGVLVDEVIYFKEHEIFSMRETVKKRLGLHF
jgi:C-terminal processing protease CtpA/Prc